MQRDELPTLLKQEQLCIRDRERWMPGLGWSQEYVFYTDGASGSGYTLLDGSETVPPVEQNPKRGWVWLKNSSWEVETETKVTDPEGWRYAWNVTVPLEKWAPKSSLNSFVRYRIWKRTIIFDPVAYLAGSAQSDEAVGKQISDQLSRLKPFYSFIHSVNPSL